MSNAWLEHLITEEEERTFAEQGYMIIENAIPKELVERPRRLRTGLTAAEKEKRGLGPGDAYSCLTSSARMMSSWSCSTIRRPFPVCGEFSAGTYSCTIRT